MDRPTFLRRTEIWLRRLLGGEQPAIPGSQPTPPTGPQSSSEETRAAVQPVFPKVSLVIYDPVLPTAGGRRLSQVLGWNDSNRLAEALIADLREVSHGYAKYTIAERIVRDTFPVKMDGYQYNGADFLRFWQARSGFHQPDAVNYHAILNENNIIQKVQDGLIDEVWTISFPYAGFYESRMAGPGAFWCNAPPLENTSQAGRRFVIMGFNYERGVGEMLESYGHRAESILQQVYRGEPDSRNLWKRYTLYDKIARGQAEVGNIHFAPNSQRDYDWGNPTPVPSRWRTWQTFPNLVGDAQTSTTRDWGGGDIRAHHKWWFSLLPHVSGQIAGISANWWEYIVNPNLVH